MLKWMGGDQRKDLEQPMGNFELLPIFYLDPQGGIQGPFMGIDIIRWFHVGFYDVNFLVKLANYLENVSFVPFGDLMPRFKANVQLTFTRLQNHLNIPSVERSSKY